MNDPDNPYAIHKRARPKHPVPREQAELTDQRLVVDVAYYNPPQVSALVRNEITGERYSSYSSISSPTFARDIAAQIYNAAAFREGVRGGPERVDELEAGILTAIAEKVADA